MAENADEERLRQLEARIAAAKGAEKPAKPHQEEHYSQAQMGWRMVTELVAGLVVGFGIGYGIDVVAGTKPIFMVVFILLGFIAGVQTKMRTAKGFQNETAADPGASGKAGEDKRG